MAAGEWLSKEANDAWPRHEVPYRSENLKAVGLENRVTNVGNGNQGEIL